VELLGQLDIELFLGLNRLHNRFFDVIMLAFTNRYYPIPLYIAMVGLIVWKYRLNGLWAILAIGLAVLLANHTTSEIMKPFFGRLRPCYNQNLTDQIHLLVPCGGQWSFASSHASSSFALAAGLWFLLRKTVSWVWVAFIWAGIVSYSRIYVGKHYPADVVAGALVGFLSAWMVYLVYRWLDRKYNLAI